MYVIAIHTIHDPAGFQKAGDAALNKGLPQLFKLPIHGATNDHSKGICESIAPSSAFRPLGHQPPQGSLSDKAQSSAARSVPVWPPETILGMVLIKQV